MCLARSRAAEAARLQETLGKGTTPSRAAEAARLQVFTLDQGHLRQVVPIDGEPLRHQHDGIYGLWTDPDERNLYVADSMAHCIRVLRLR